MKIAFVITRADAVGGATVHVRDLAAALIRAGHQAVVLVGGTGAVTAAMKSAGVPFVSLRHLRRSINPVHDVLAVRELANAIRRVDPDAVSAHTAKAGCVARLACKGMEVPVLYTPHGWSTGDRVSRLQGLVYRQIERFAAPLSAAIVNVCQYERSLATEQAIGSAGQHAVIYNGMPDVTPELRANPRLEPARIVMVARFEEPKDHATLITALGGLMHLPWQLDLVGDGPLMGAMRSRVETLHMAGRVNFLGALKSPAIPLAEAQIFALATRSEAFPRSILEAMRAGLPVVASNVGGIGEAVENGRTGYVVPRQSVGTMQEALERLIANPFLRASFGAAGRRAYEQRFTFDRMFQQTFSIYEQLTGAPALAGAGRRAGWLPQPQ